MSDPKSMLLTDDELDRAALDEFTRPPKVERNQVALMVGRAIAKAQLRKIADWIDREAEDNTHLHVGDLTSRLREAAGDE